jgi:hypothetical protein
MQPDWMHAIAITASASRRQVENLVVDRRSRSPVRDGSCFEQLDFGIREIHVQGQ